MQDILQKAIWNMIVLYLKERLDVEQMRFV
jgi:hypothetical protein